MNELAKIGFLFCSVTLSACAAAVTDKGSKDPKVGVKSGSTPPKSKVPATITPNPAVSAEDTAVTVNGLKTTLGALLPSKSGSSSKTLTDINLQSYFPDTLLGTNYNDIYGNYKETYRFYDGDANFQQVYNTYQSLSRPGKLKIWEKRNNSDTTKPALPYGNCVPTYGMLWFGTDQSVVEVGDWFSGVGGCAGGFAFAYRDGQNRNTGLSWSNGTSGSELADYVIVRPISQTVVGGPIQGSSFIAFSWVGLVEVLENWTPDYGRDATTQKWQKGSGKSYKDVARIVLYHGVRDTSKADPNSRCETDPKWPWAGYYKHFDGYQSYALEFYLAPNEGIIEYSFLFNETTNYFPPSLYCKGLALGKSDAKQDTFDINNGLVWKNFADTK